MSGNAWSDLLLALVTLPLAWRLRAGRPGVAGAFILIGLAAVFGVLRYSGIDMALGPHRFFSLVAACSGLPMLAVSRCWPNGEVASRGAAAGRFGVLAAGIGVLLVGIVGFTLWSDVVAAASALLIVWAAVPACRALPLLAGWLLVVSFMASATGIAFAPFTAVQELHILMAISLALIGWEELRGATGGRAVKQVV
ncbi:MAG: hypothetical protein V4463_17915 [Pseudomonadota bacterium]